MKKITTLLFTIILAASASAQVFWSENFGTTCLPRASLATSYVGPNGSWTETSIGTNEMWGNEFYINDRISYTGIGNCATGNDLGCTTNNNCLHVGGKAILTIEPADSSSYWTGFFGSAATAIRIESPVINCTGKNNVTLTFVYYEGGDHANGDLDGDATLVYYDGTTWTKISDLVKLPDFTNGSPRPICTGTEYGQFGTFSINLPASANNNSAVKIGFTWTNNDDGTGTDPSFAVDSIQVSGSGGSVLPPHANIATLGDSSACSPVCLYVTDNSTNNPTSWLWTFTGAATTTSTAQNPGQICWDSSGTYSIKLKVSNSAGSDSVTFSNYVTVYVTPNTPTITFSGDTLYTSYDPLASSYQWSDSAGIIPGATKSYLVITRSGNYNVSVGNSDGCKIATGITVTYVGTQIYSLNNMVNMFPNPAKNEVTVSGNWQSSSGTLSVIDILGKKVKDEVIKLDKHVTINVNDLPEGIYYIQIVNDRGRWAGKFVKD